jgi:transposase InsO family protein
LGESVAARLEQLFLRHGPPLLLKLDNGSNLNHQAVDEVLARYLVIPLNSPPHYPPYNGGMECAVRELKTPLVKKILAGSPLPESQVQAWAEVLAHELNHRSHGCLHGQVACEVFQDAKPAMKAYTLRKRKESFDWINTLTRTLI